MRGQHIHCDLGFRQLLVNLLCICRSYVLGKDDSCCKALDSGRNGLIYKAGDEFFFKRCKLLCISYLKGGDCKKGIVLCRGGGNYVKVEPPSAFGLLPENGDAVLLLGCEAVRRYNLDVGRIVRHIKGKGAVGGGAGEGGSVRYDHPLKQPGTTVHPAFHPLGKGWYGHQNC